MPGEGLLMQAKPLNDRILVRIRPLPPITAGLVIGIGGDGLSSEADVLAVGPGARDKKGRIRPLDIQVGERVLVARGGPGAPIHGTCVDERERLYMIREADIIAVIEYVEAAAA